jgi:hypothetical protein
MNLCKIIKNKKESSHKTFTDKQNKLSLNKFSKIPFNERIVFVPHCLRKTDLCQAKECGSFYICAGCGQCKIAQIDKLAKELNYKKLYILKGGRAILKIIEADKPKAILGVACFFEGYQAFKLLKDTNIVIQFVSLTKDGCADTDLDLSEIKATMLLQTSNEK